RVVLLPQVIGPTDQEDDRRVLERIAMKVTADCVMEDLSHNDVNDALRTFMTIDFLIATRLHSAILASCASVPFVVLEYIGGKATGAVEDLHLPSWVRLSDFSDLPKGAQRGWIARNELEHRIGQGFSRVLSELETLSLN